MSFVSQTLCNSLVTEGKYYRIYGGVVGFLSISIFLGRTVCNFLKMWDEVSRNNWLLILCIMVPNSSTSEESHLYLYSPEGQFLE